MATTAVDPILHDLEALLGPGRARADFPTLTAYAIDAGIYKIPPRVVVLLERADEIPAILAYAHRTGVPITARSAGTNLTGSAIGAGIILDFSRLRRILHLDPEARTVRVEPGIIYQELNAALLPHGLIFAPDPSSGEMCKLGGMLANNSAGPHTLKYGAVKDNTVSLAAYLADGQRIQARSYGVGEAELTRLLSRHAGLQEAVDLVRAHATLIRSRRRAVSKNSSGYNLFDLAEGLDRDRLDLHQLFIGSEGTLALIAEATLKLVPRPARTATALLHFARLQTVGEAVGRILKLGPGALELMDRNTLDLIGREKFGIPASAEATLLVEFDTEPIEERVAALVRQCPAWGLAVSPEVATEPDHQAALWKARRAIYPALYRFDAKRHPVNFADDVVVPAAAVPELIPYLDQYFRGMGVSVAIYGHIGDGNAHINPLLNLKDPADFDRMARIGREIHHVVIERFGGSICGEHGDGRVRAEFVRDLYGPEVYDLFVRIKRLLDPQGILNPGVKISDVPFTEHVDTERLSKPCATCGRCNSVCPAYDVEREESSGARGWYHILTAPDYRYEKAARVVEACLNCRSCFAVCPAGIDVGALVLKKRAEHPVPLAGALCRLRSRRVLWEGFLKTAAWTQPIWNSRAGRVVLDRLTRPIFKRLAPTARLSPGIAIPPLARRTLRQRHRVRTEEAGRTGRLAYFHGCAANYFDDGVGDAVIEVLERLGGDPVLPRQDCSGTPIQTYGQQAYFEAAARLNLGSLERYETVVTGCASCTFMLKEYANLFSDGEDGARARALAGKVMHLSEWVAKNASDALPAAAAADASVEPKASAPDDAPTVTYHSSCHLRAAGVSAEPRALLQRIPGMRYVEMADADRCAGGAGTFLVKNPEMSRAIFARKARAIEASGARVVATSCPACIVQLNTQLGTGGAGRSARGRGGPGVFGGGPAFEVRHIAHLLRDALRSPGRPV